MEQNTGPRASDAECFLFCIVSVSKLIRCEDNARKMGLKRVIGVSYEPRSKGERECYMENSRLSFCIEVSVESSSQAITGSSKFGMELQRQCFAINIGTFVNVCKTSKSVVEKEF